MNVLCNIFFSLHKPDTLIVNVTCSEADIEKASFKIVTRVSIRIFVVGDVILPSVTNTMQLQYHDSWGKYSLVARKHSSPGYEVDWNEAMDLPLCYLRHLA